MFGKGGYYGEAEGGEAILTKGVMANPALARMASAINVAAGGRPLFKDGGMLTPIQPSTASSRIGEAVTEGVNSQVPVLVVEHLKERERRVEAIESLRTI